MIISEELGCSECGGACCHVVTLMKAPAFRPDSKKQGPCEHFIGGKCDIYETRPLICRTNKSNVKLTKIFCEELKVFFRKDIDYARSS